MPSVAVMFTFRLPPSHALQMREVDLPAAAGGDLDGLAVSWWWCTLEAR